MCSESFSQDVVEDIVNREDWHAIILFDVTDSRCIVHVCYFKGDVLRVGQTVAVSNFKLIFEGTKLVRQRSDGHCVAILVPINKNIVECDKVTISRSPCEICFKVLYIVNQVREAEGVGSRVFCNSDVSECSLNFRASTSHVKVDCNVSSKRQVSSDGPIIGTICFCLDHNIVVLCHTWSVGALVRAVDKNFIIN